MSESEAEDIISIVIDIFNQSFSQIDLPACIAIVDTDGFTLVTTGLCPEMGLFEGQIATAVASFESLKERFLTSFNESLNLITLEFDDQAFYMDDLHKSGADLYLVAQCSSINLLVKARPFLTSIVQKIELMFTIQANGAE
ncbi:MAG: hypothetical protein ACXAC7_10465 [Candidatus Hodarchaeales archaeon]|jgi:hypothetical protein